MMDILEEARDVLHQEAQGIEKLIPTLDQNFVNAVNLIMESHGRVIVTGMGKSGHIARKVAATLSSTGTPSIFLHPAEGIHGDLGMVTADDVVLAFQTAGKPLKSSIPCRRSNALGRNSSPSSATIIRPWLNMLTSSSMHPLKKKPAP